MDYYRNFPFCCIHSCRELYDIHPSQHYVLCLAFDDWNGSCLLYTSHTAIVTVEIPKEYVMEGRFINRHFGAGQEVNADE